MTRPNTSKLTNYKTKYEQPCQWQDYTRISWPMTLYTNKRTTDGFYFFQSWPMTRLDTNNLTTARFKKKMDLCMFSCSWKTVMVCPPSFPVISRSQTETGLQNYGSGSHRSTHPKYCTFTSFFLFVAAPGRATAYTQTRRRRLFYTKRRIFQISGGKAETKCCAWNEPWHQLSRNLAIIRGTQQHTVIHTVVLRTGDGWT